MQLQANRHFQDMPKILLVEDNAINRDMLSRRLQRKGYQVIEAVDGLRAVELTKTEMPDLILMDVSLPLLDGWEATRQIKANLATKHTFIIALTAHVAQSDRDQSFAAGCDDYDTKPVDLPILIAKMEGLLKGRAAVSEGINSI